jgi:hypothetical protein
LKQGHKKATRLFMRGAKANVNRSLAGLLPKLSHSIRNCP